MSQLKISDTSGRVEELPEAECGDLLAARSVGRIAFNGPDGPMILPVNYTHDAGDIVFRTAPYNILATSLRHAVVAFEVDDMDDYLHCGWSVVVQGHASYVDDVQHLVSGLDARPEPWVDGTRPLYIRITPRLITGRRVHHG